MRYAVRIVEPTREALREADDSGRVFLALGPDTELRMSKTLDRVGEIGRITQEAALSVSLPNNNRNRAILQHIDPDALEPSAATFGIEVTSDGERVSLTEARLIEFNPQTGYEVEFYGDDWLQAIEAVRLRDVSMGVYEWSRANIVNTWTSSARPQPFVLPGLAEYGDWLGDGEVSLRDLRLWFNVGQLLKEIFCAAGWSFVCPHLDEGDGRFWYGYLSGVRWHTYRTKNDPQLVQISNAGETVDGSLDNQPTYTVDDPGIGGAFGWTTFARDDRPTYHYRHDFGTDEPTLITVEVEIDVNLPEGPGSETPQFYVIVNRYNFRSITPIEVYRNNYLGGEGGDRRLTLSLFFYVEATIPKYIDQISGTEPTAYVPRFEVVFEYRLGDGTPVSYTVNSSSIVFRPDPRYYIEGDNIHLADLLNPELNGRDILEGVAHLINGKTVTDYGRKEVTLHVPYRYERTEDGQRIEGFFQRERPPVDMRLRTVPNGLAWSWQEQERSRFLVLDFSDGNDAYVDQNGRERFRRRVDYGTGVESEDSSENPLFEPTLGRFVEDTLIGGSGAFIPVLWEEVPDESTGERTRSHDIGPRIAVWYGDVNQEGNSWQLDGQVRFTVPVLLMLPDAGLPIDTVAEPLTFSGYATDLYNRHHRQEQRENRQGATLRPLIAGGDVSYDEIDFRRTLIIQGPTGDIEIQPTAVRDHPRGTNVPLAIEARVIKC